MDSGPEFRYHSLRNTSRVFRDGYRRRSRAVESLIREVGRLRFRLLDIGSADGLMLKQLCARCPEADTTVLESRSKMVQIAGGLDVRVIGGRAEAMPFNRDSFDFVTIISTLKHISDYVGVLTECRRVLVSGGHLIVSDPTPFGLRLGLLFGHFDRKTLPNRWSLRTTQHIIEANGFRCIRGFRYMPAPVTFPCNGIVENGMRIAGLSGLFMQQIMLARLLGPSST